MQILSVEEATRQWLRREYFKAALTGLCANTFAYERTALQDLVEEAWMFADEAIKQEQKPES